MKKKKEILFWRCAAKIKRLYVVKSLLVLMMFAMVNTISASSNAQIKKVSVHTEGVNLVEFFEEIRKQSDYNFFFNEEKIVGFEKITMNKQDIPVNELLDELFEGSAYEYKISGNVIVIREAAKQAPNKARKISGIVRDASTGEILVGVNIRVKNSILGSITDVNGRFEMALPPHATILTFTYIGFKNQEIVLDERAQYEINLEADMEEIDDVVVTGYQVINKRELTSSIATIKSDDLEKVSPLTIDQMLEGKATGLMISTLSSTPGAASKIRIRSSGTFTGNQEPLWVVDGVIYEDPVPLSAEEINSFDNVNLIGNAITGINPQDIETINVLKDASATAIYGTRAANGVIVVTTKRGKIGNPSFNYSGSVSYQDRPRYSDLNLMNSKERIAVSREIYEKNQGYPAALMTGNGNYSYGYEGALQRFWDGTYSYADFQEQVSYLETVNADWFDALYQPSISQKHSVSVSGGAPNVRYYMSLGYDDSQGTERGVGVERITARTNLDIDIRDNVLLSVNMSGSVNESKYNHSSINTFNEAYYNSRTVPVYNTDGSLLYQPRLITQGDFDNDTEQEGIYGNYHILNEMEHSARNITNKDFNISASLKWDLAKGLSWRTQASYRNTTNLTEEWIDENTYFIAELRTYDAFEDMQADVVNSSATVPFGGIYSGGSTSQKSTSITNQLNFNKVINEKHVLNVNLGQEARSVKYDGASGWTAPGYNHAQGRSFIQLPSVTASTDGAKVADGYMNMITWLTENDGSSYPSITDRLSNTISGFGILTYSFDNRYIANFNIRSDGSNTFGQYERYKFRPAWSASARWNIHNESFFASAGILDELALRVSYGFRGTMPNASPYLTISGYGRLNATYYPETISKLASFPNANLSWETTKTTNVGLNYSLFAGRISGAADYGYSRGDGLLLSSPVSLVNGQNSIMYNGGSKEVHSFEFAINTVNVKTKNFRWSTYVNFSFDRDKVLDGFNSDPGNNYGNTNTVDDYLSGSIYAPGFPSAGFFSYQFNGLDEQGLPTFKNLVDEEDRSIKDHLQDVLVYEGSRTPRYYGGFGTRVSYKRLTLSANFSYKFGYKIRMLKLYQGSQNMPMPIENMSAQFLDRWTKPGDEAFTTIPGLSSADLRIEEYEADGKIQASNSSYIIPSGGTGWSMYDLSDARTVKGDHIRWQSISLNYNLPKKMIQRIGVSNLNMGFQCANIAVWSFDKNLKGQDPEQVQGIGMPALPTYSFSVNIGL